MDVAEEVLDVAFPAGDQAMEIVEPGEKPLHFPAPFVPAQRSPILGFAASAPIGRDQLDILLSRELLVEPVRVTGFVANQLEGQLVKEASGQNLFHKEALGR